MKNLLYFFLVVFILISCRNERHEAFDLIISDVNLIDGTGGALQENVTVFIKDSLIVKIASAQLGDEKVSKVIDGQGKYLMPGLFDCHTHVNDHTRDLSKFIQYGITSIFVTGGSTCTNEYYATLRRLGRQDSIPTPRVFHTSQHFIKKGSHPVKTYGSSNWKEGETVFYLKDTLQIEQLVREVAKYPIEGIKLTIEEGPDPPFIERLSQTFINKVQREAEKQGTRVFVHISDNTELEMALDAGISNFVHFTGVDLDFSKDTTLLKKIYERPVNWVTTFMLDKSFIYPLRPHWIENILSQGIYSAESMRRTKDTAYISRAHNYNVYMKEYLQTDTITLKNISAFQVDDIRKLSENGVNMVLGTDTGNAFILPGHSLHEEMQMLEIGGLAPETILRMGTMNAAKMLRVEDELGSISAGKKADMLLLDKNPLDGIKNTLSINKVIKNGVVQQRIHK